MTISGLGRQLSSSAAGKPNKEAVGVPSIYLALLKLSSGRRPEDKPPPTDSGAPGLGTAITIVMEEYRAREAEKRLMMQAFLAVTGLLAAGIAAVATTTTAENLLPLALLPPAIVGSMCVAVVLRSYVDAYVVFLSVLEEEVNQISTAAEPLLTWNQTAWSWLWGPDRPVGRGARLPLSGAMGGSVGSFLVAGTASGLILLPLGVVIVNSAPFVKSFSSPVPELAAIFYTLGNIVLLVMLTFIWVTRRRRLVAIRSRFADSLARTGNREEIGEGALPK